MLTPVPPRLTAESGEPRTLADWVGGIIAVLAVGAMVAFVAAPVSWVLLRWWSLFFSGGLF